MPEGDSEGLDIVRDKLSQFWADDNSEATSPEPIEKLPKKVNISRNYDQFIQAYIFCSK